MADADDQPSPSWAAYFDRPEFCAQVASCYLLLGKHAEAEEWLIQSLAAQPKERLSRHKVPVAAALNEQVREVVAA